MVEILRSCGEEKSENDGGGGGGDTRTDDMYISYLVTNHIY
jgi:hypothetical protein